MTWDPQDRRTCEASRTAVESLLRTLDDAAHWENRAASRVRAFARPRLRSVADDAPGRGDLLARHAPRAVRAAQSGDIAADCR
jgi:hypothetical protein